MYIKEREFLASQCDGNYGLHRPDRGIRSDGLCAGTQVFSSQVKQYWLIRRQDYVQTTAAFLTGIMCRVWYGGKRLRHACGSPAVPSKTPAERIAGDAKN